MQNHIKKTVTERSDDGVSTMAKETTQDTQTQTIASLIYFVSGVIEIILAFRFVFKLTGANPGSTFVSMIYNISRVLIQPFSGIFPTAVTTGLEVKAVFEPTSLVALLVYAVLTWGIIKLVYILAGHSTEEV